MLSSEPAHTAQTQPRAQAPLCKLLQARLPGVLARVPPHPSVCTPGDPYPSWSGPPAQAVAVERHRLPTDCVAPSLITCTPAQRCLPKHLLCDHYCSELHSAHARMPTAQTVTGSQPSLPVPVLAAPVSPSRGRPDPLASLALSHFPSSLLGLLICLAHSAGRGLTGGLRPFLTPHSPCNSHFSNALSQCFSNVLFWLVLWLSVLFL